MRSDPSDTRWPVRRAQRPGTAPTHYRGAARSAAARRASAWTARWPTSCSRDGLVSLLCWGPIPIACLWVGSQAEYLSGSVSIGILSAFVALFVLLFGA